MKNITDIDEVIKEKKLIHDERQRYCSSFNNLSELKEYTSGRDLIIYGAGQGGRNIFKKLSNYGVKITDIWDTNADKLNHQYINDVFPIDKEITKPDLNPSKYNDPIIFVSAGLDKDCENIGRELWEKGFRDLFFRHNELYGVTKFCCIEDYKNGLLNFDIDDCLRCMGMNHDDCGGYNGYCDIYQKKLMKIAGIDPTSKLETVINSLPVVVTSRCTLNCEGCGVEMGGPDGIDFPVDKIVNDIKKLVDSVDFINMIGPVGGEILLHKNLYELLVELAKIPNIGLIILSTNGTVPLKDNKIYELLCSPRFGLRISSYEGSISDNIQNKVKDFVKKLDKYGVSYKYHRVAEWYDYSDWSYRNYNEERLAKQIFCFGRGFWLYDGILTQCSPSLVAGLKGKMPLFKKDHIYIRELNHDEIRQRLKPIIHPLVKPLVFSACGYCDGATSKTIPVAKQVKHR